MSATYTLRMYCVLAIFEAGWTTGKSFPITLVKNVPKSAGKSVPITLVTDVPETAGKSVPISVC